MQYYIVEPEVAGGLGPNTVMDQTVHPPIVTRLHYELHGWLGDAILESFPCFIVTPELKRSIERSRLRGVNFASCELGVSREFQEHQPETGVPDFAWLQVSGRCGVDDFGAMKDGRLVVSERALELLKPHGLKHAVISPFVPE